MPLIPIDSILVGRRQRKKIETGPLDDLKRSILEVGLLQPLVVRPSGDGYDLLVGERRLRAIQQLLEEGAEGRRGNVDFNHRVVAATVLLEEDLARLLQIEYDENTHRVNLTWQEQTAALAAIHELRKAENPGQTTHNTAVEIVEKNPTVTLSTAQRHITRATILSHVLERPDIAAAKSAEAAYALWLKNRHEAFSAKLAERHLRSVREIERLWTIEKGDLRDRMKELADGEVDLILSDPPYGIDINKWRYGGSRNHNYNDAEEYARDLGIYILQEGWRVTRPKANIFIFCSWRSFPFFFEQARLFGWEPWPSGPLIWYKSTMEGEAPWGRRGCCRTNELIFWATKGQKGLNGPVPDTLVYPRVHSTQRNHAAEKPQTLLIRLIQAGSDTGELVLDPTCGGGSTLVAATTIYRRSFGIEIDDDAYNAAMTRLASGQPKEKEA